MALESDKSIVLLPVQPRFTALILSGEKKVEFRKVRFRNELSHVVLYATNPVKRILGYFEVSYIDEDSPDELWARYNHIGGIVYEEFNDYYCSSTRGVAIGVGTLYVLNTPILLESLRGSTRAPQSFVYLTHNDLATIRDHCSL